MIKEKTSVRFLRIIICLLTVAVVISALTSCVSDTKKVSEGKKTITVTVVDDKGESSVYHIETESEYLRGAIEEKLGLEGEESEYGLYVKTVNGITADFDENGAYWSFSQNGEMMMTGVDSTPVSDGDTFDIVYTKG